MDQTAYHSRAPEDLIVAIALAAKPVRMKKVSELLVGKTPGTTEFDSAVEAVADQAYRQCKPLPNIPGDDAYRREMVPVYARHTLRAAAAGEGPIHAL